MEMFYDDEGRFNWPKFLLSAGLTLMVIGMLWMGIDKLSSRYLLNSITADLQQVEPLSIRVKQARDTWRDNFLLFADHWSTGQDENLSLSEAYVGKDGIPKDLEAAKNALENNERTVANQHLAIADSKITQATETANVILGDGYSPGLYDRLHQNQNQADGTIIGAQSCITTSWESLKAYESSDNYSDGVNDLVQAQSSLDLANTTNTTTIERGLIDKPLAYDYATTAQQHCSRAISDAEPTPPTPVPQPTEEEQSDTEITIINILTSGDDDPVYSSDDEPLGTDPFTQTYEEPSTTWEEPVWEEPSYEAPDTSVWDEPSYEVEDTSSWDDPEW